MEGNIFTRYIWQKTTSKWYKELINRKWKTQFTKMDERFKETRQKKIFRKQICTWKYPPHYMSPGKFKLQWDTAAHLLEWPEYRTLRTATELVRVGRSRNSHSLQNGTATSEDSLAASYKIKYILTRQPSNHTRLYRIYTNDLKTYVHTQTCTGVPTAVLFAIAQTWKEPGYSSAGKWTDYGTYRQQNSIHWWKEMSYQSMKRHGGTLNACYKWLKPILKGYKSKCMTFWKR